MKKLFKLVLPVHFIFFCFESDAQIRFPATLSNNNFVYQPQTEYYLNNDNTLQNKNWMKSIAFDITNHAASGLTNFNNEPDSVFVKFWFADQNPIDWNLFFDSEIKIHCRSFANFFGSKKHPVFYGEELFFGLRYLALDHRLIELPVKNNSYYRPLNIGSSIQVFPNPVQFGLSVYFSTRPQQPYYVNVYHTVGVFIKSFQQNATAIKLRIPQWKEVIYSSKQ